MLWSAIIILDFWWWCQRQKTALPLSGCQSLPDLIKTWRLVYHHLPSASFFCFLSCGIFPLGFFFLPVTIFTLVDAIASKLVVVLEWKQLSDAAEREVEEKAWINIAWVFSSGIVFCYSPCLNICAYRDSTLKENARRRNSLGNV